MNSKTLDSYAHASRLATLFAAWFVPFTTLDLATTWIGHRYFADRMNELGIVEGNPLTDMSSMGALVMPEVVALAVGVVMVFGGGVLKKRRLSARGECEADLAGLRLRAFQKEYDRLGTFASVLVIVPMVVAVGRVYPGVNNLMWLVVGWGPTALFGAFFTAMLACFLAVYPAYYMIQKRTLNRRTGGDTDAAAAADRRNSNRPVAVDSP